MKNDLQLVEAIFTKLTLRYGRDFLAQWEGIDLNDVKADWALELEGIRSESVVYALKNLPDKAMNVGVFRSIALRAPAPEMVRIDAPAANPEIVKKALDAARAACNLKVVV